LQVSIKFFKKYIIPIQRNFDTIEKFDGNAIIVMEVLIFNNLKNRYEILET
jgi:hypothetical protein